jgi:AbrB family looped-hinge helix DNA binding protein
MKKYAKIVQSDNRGQIVIPKEVRRELNIDEGAGFYVYIIEQEGLFLKLIPSKELGEHAKAVDELKTHANQLKIKPQQLDSSVANYKKIRRGNFEDV